MPKGVKVLSDPRDSEIRYLKGIVTLYESRINDLEMFLSEHGTESTGIKVHMHEELPEKKKVGRPKGPHGKAKRPVGRPRKSTTLEETHSVAV